MKLETSDNCSDNSASICSGDDERMPLTFDDCARRTMANWEQVALETRRFASPNAARIDETASRRKRGVYASSYYSQTERSREK